MPTIKLVVIGASGVGKTSLRGQYISGRFTNVYRATIGADFITKTIPHPTKPSESVTLQIWDTAGQERFSSLSTAFFRGADAALLMFDVNSPDTMTALTKWWADFCRSAPLAEEDMEDYCCVVVGNKIDLIDSGDANGYEPVTEASARKFLNELVPPTVPVLDDEVLNDQTVSEPETINPLESSQLTHRPSVHIETSSFLPISPSTSPLTPRPITATAAPLRSDSIAITNPSTRHPYTPSYSPKHRLSKSRSRPSSSHFYTGTMTTTHTALTVYHTPSSSVFDVFHSARSSPEPWSSPPSRASTSPRSPSNSLRGRRRTTSSSGSASSGSAATITPSLFAARGSSSSSALTTSTTPEGNSVALTGPLSPQSDMFSPLLPPSERGPKLFFTSAKTGDYVKDVFEYIVLRVIERWEYEDRLEARRMHIRETSAAETIHLGMKGHQVTKSWTFRESCCGA